MTGSSEQLTSFGDAGLGTFLASGMHRKFVAVVALMSVERFLLHYSHRDTGCPPADCRAVVQVVIAKVV